MKKRSIRWRAIIVVAICLAVTLTVITALKVPRSEVKGSTEVSTSRAKTMIPLVRVDEAEVSMSLNKSTMVNQTNISAIFQNLTHPEVCVQQWREDIISLEEALHCIDRSTEGTKQYR